MKTTVWVKMLMALAILFALMVWPTVASAQEVDFPLSSAPSSAGAGPEPQRFVGNYCGAFGGISMRDEDDRTFEVDVPGTPVGAYIYWSGRGGLNEAGDAAIQIGRNGGPLQDITADVETVAVSDNNYQWFTYAYNALQGTDPLIGPGVNSLRVTSMDIPERHGIGALVVYENADLCPYQQIDLFFGNDVLYKGWDGSSGPHSEVTCVDFPAPPEPIEIDIQMFVGGIENPLRSDAIWYATGMGAKPVNLVNESFAFFLDEQLEGLAGNEFDNYDTFVQDPQPIVVKGGDTWACFQIESPEPPNPGKTKGISATWINLAVRIPLANIAITPDGVNPLNDPHTFTVTVESSLSFQSLTITPSVEPTPDEQSTTCDNPVIEGATATCTLTINSSMPGVFTATAEAIIDLGNITATVVTNGRGNSSLPAIKTYIPGPAIDIEKATNGEDADDPTGPYIPVDGAVNWTYVVTNIGDVDLFDVIVVDDQGVVVTCPQTTLVVGESMTCTGQGVAVAGQYVNIGTVTGQTSTGQQVNDEDPSHYFGYIPAAIGDFVFGDSNPDGETPAEIVSGNGLQDEGELGVDGIIVQLYTSDDVLVAETVTADGGFYEFVGLIPGDYYVVFINPFDEGLWTFANIGDNDAVDSDGDLFLPVTVEIEHEGDVIRTDIISLEPGEYDSSWDAGLVGLSTLGSSALGDRVWLDRDKDGIQDDVVTEPGIADVLVTLYKVLDGGELEFVADMISGTSGDYLFEGLDPGSYVVEFSLPADFTVSPLSAGGDATLDSDANAIDGRTQEFYLPSYMIDRTWDAGIYQTPTAIEVIDEPVAPGLRIFLPLIMQ